MSYASIVNRVSIQLGTPAYENAITAALTQIYEDSDAGDAIDTWLAANPSKNLIIKVIRP